MPRQQSRLPQVSILTRPYGRMLYGLSVQVSRRSRFQSSPALTGGCYYARPFHRHRSRIRFNPHPPLRADAMRTRTHSAYTSLSFNPHPPLRADAIDSKSVSPGHHTVSILTRPYGRMLSSLRPHLLDNPLVSILTRPYGRMLFKTWPDGVRPDQVSILTRPYGRML